jgi:hypothetical protein
MCVPFGAHKTRPFAHPLLISTIQGRLRVHELKDLLRQLAKPVSGNKPDLMLRLNAAAEKEPAVLLQLINTQQCVVSAKLSHHRSSSLFFFLLDGCWCRPSFLSRGRQRTASLHSPSGAGACVSLTSSPVAAAAIPGALKFIENPFLSESRPLIPCTRIASPANSEFSASCPPVLRFSPACSSCLQESIHRVLPADHPRG